MSNPWAAEAILKIGPRANGDTLAGNTATNRSAIGAASAASDVFVGAANPMGSWCTFISTTDCFIHFGPSGASDIAASASVSTFLPAGTFFECWVMPRVNDRVVVIRSTADGFLYRWQSNQ